MWLIDSLIALKSYDFCPLWVACLLPRWSRKGIGSNYRPNIPLSLSPLESTCTLQKNTKIWFTYFFVCRKAHHFRMPGYEGRRPSLKFLITQSELRKKWRFYNGTLNKLQTKWNLVLVLILYTFLLGAVISAYAVSAYAAFGTGPSATAHFKSISLQVATLILCRGTSC